MYPSKKHILSSNGTPLHNIVRDYDKAQGTTHPTDLSYQIIRDYNVRYLNIQNSSPRPIGIAITNYCDGPVPPIRFSLAGGEIKHLGVNSRGGPTQAVWIIDLQTKKPVGTPYPIQSKGNALVLRDGLNKWWIQTFAYPSSSPAH